MQFPMRHSTTFLSIEQRAFSIENYPPVVYSISPRINKHLS